MTETTRIRWSDDYEGDVPHLAGRTGTIDADLFKIWPPDERDSQWLLTSELPGQDYAVYGDNEDELKIRAAELLTEFVSSLVAVFPEDEISDDDLEEPIEVRFAAGRRVRFAHPDAGYPGEAEDAARRLIPGGVYTVAWADIGFSSSRIGLAGIQDHGQGFNSVLFEPAEDAEPVPSQPEEAGQ